MLTNLTKWCLFISSYFPLYSLLLIKILIIHNLSIKNSFKNNPLSTLIILSLIFLSVIIIVYMITIKPNSTINNKDIHNMKFKNEANEVLNYFITYIFPILSLDFNDSGSIIVNLVIFFLIGIFYVKSNIIHINPLLLLFGYNLFKIDDRIIITRKSKESLKELLIINKSICVRELASDIYIEKTPKNSSYASKN